MLEDESPPRKRAQRAAVAADTAGRVVVLELRTRVDAWLEQLVRLQWLRTLGRSPTLSLEPMLRDMQNARHLLRSELQALGLAVRTSSAVVNVKRSLDRAIEIARRLQADRP